MKTPSNKSRNLNRLNKKSQVKVITIILLILMIFLLIILIWNLILGLIKEGTIETEVKADFLKMKMNIDDVQQLPSGTQIGGGPNDPERVGVNVNRGAERILIETRVEEININADIVSVVDLSSSMGQFYSGKCVNRLNNKMI